MAFVGFFCLHIIYNEKVLFLFCFSKEWVFFWFYSKEFGNLGFVLMLCVDFPWFLGNNICSLREIGVAFLRNGCFLVLF